MAELVYLLRKLRQPLTICDIVVSAESSLEISERGAEALLHRTGIRDEFFELKSSEAPVSAEISEENKAEESLIESVHIETLTSAEPFADREVLDIIPSDVIQTFPIEYVAEPVLVKHIEHEDLETETIDETVVREDKDKPEEGTIERNRDLDVELMNSRRFGPRDEFFEVNKLITPETLVHEETIHRESAEITQPMAESQTFERISVDRFVPELVSPIDHDLASRFTVDAEPGEHFVCLRSVRGGGLNLFICFEN